MKIFVKPAKDFKEDSSEIYATKNNPRGHVLIINNITFTNDEKYKFRRGADVDSSNLLNLFLGLGFTVHSHRNLTKTRILNTLNNFAGFEGHKEADMTVICVMSHGSSS